MSKQGIIIVTSEKTKDFLRDCVMSCLQDKYPIMVVSNMYIVPEAILGVEYVNMDWNGFELAGIKVGMERFDEFLLLHDTMIVKDKALFDLVFSNPKSVYLSAESMAYHYTAKYQSEFLKKMVIPKVNTVREATNEERRFGNEYVAISGAVPLEPLMGCGQYGDPIVEMHGRKGIIVENCWISKHKTNY